MNDNLDIFELFREVFSVKTTDIAELMPTKAEQLEEVYDSLLGSNHDGLVSKYIQRMEASK